MLLNNRKWSLPCPHLSRATCLHVSDATVSKNMFEVNSNIHYKTFNPRNIPKVTLRFLLAQCFLSSLLLFFFTAISLLSILCFVASGTALHPELHFNIFTVFHIFKRNVFVLVSLCFVWFCFVICAYFLFEFKVVFLVKNRIEWEWDKHQCKQSNIKYTHIIMSLCLKERYHYQSKYRHSRIKIM